MVPDQVSVVPSSVVASVSTFAEAQQTVDYLRSFGMDGRSLEVVGAELRLSRRQAAVPVVRRTALSAAAGALLGVLSGVFVTLVAETTLSAFAVLLWGFVYGVLVGALWGLFQGLVRNRPDAPPVETIAPTYYEVRCTIDDAAVALRLLDTDPIVEPTRTATPELAVEPEPATEPVPETPYQAPEPSPFLVEPPQRPTTPELQPTNPNPLAESRPANKPAPAAEAKPDAEPTPEAGAEPAPVAAELKVDQPHPSTQQDRKPAARRQPTQTSRKARAKKKAAQTNAA